MALMAVVVGCFVTYCVMESVCSETYLLPFSPAKERAAAPGEARVLLLSLVPLPLAAMGHV